MKKINLVITAFLACQFTFSQESVNIINKKDPFYQMVLKMYSTDAMTFQARFREKKLFEQDTTVAYAKVTLKKNENSISFLNIIPETGNKELLFCQDSAWLADHTAGKILCLGTTLDDLTHNYIAQFFPFAIFDIDTSIFESGPFWHVLDRNRKFSVVSLDIKDHSPDMSNIRVEFTIGRKDFLLARTIREFTYMNADFALEEQRFSNYTFPDTSSVKIPGYYSQYQKDLSIFTGEQNTREADSLVSAREVYLENIELFDLEGNYYALPGDGLIFFDLWYVGCAPCMRSAPVIEKLYQEFSDRVYFFSVNEVDQDTAKIKLFREKMGITFPVLTGHGGELAMKVTGRNGYPLFFLMDAETGKVVWSLTGLSDDLESLIRNAMKNNL